jgi:hypothetical protein
LGNSPVAIGDLIVVEALQGFRNDRDPTSSQWIDTQGP